MITSVAIWLALATTGNCGDSWPQFRGPDGQGHSDVHELPADWENPENILWKTSIPGRGWSSPVVLDGQVWLTTALETEGSAELRERKLAGDPFADVKDVIQSVSMHAIGIDLHTGTVLQDVDLTEIDEPEPIHSLNSYASPTPVLEHGRLHCNFGTFCVDVPRGEILWRQQLQLQHSVGPGSSPLLVDGLLILTCDGLEEQYVAALDSATGDLVWRTDRPTLSGDNIELHKAFCTPILVGLATGQQLIVPGAQWAVAYEPRNGKETWRLRHGEGFSLVPRPVAADGLIYMYTGFSGKGLFAIRSDGEGDVTDSHVVWNQDGVDSKRPSPLLIDGLIYTVTERGVASCVDAESGEIVWRERLGGNFSASLLYAANRIYAFSEEGVVTVFQPRDMYQELEKHELNERIMASPAVVDESILLRTDECLYRIGRAG